MPRLSDGQTCKDLPIQRLLQFYDGRAGGAARTSSEGLDFDFDGGDDESDDENAAIDNTDHKEEYQAAVKAILRGLF